MQAYVTPATVPSSQLRLLDGQQANDQTAVLDLILNQLATRVADQIAARLTAVHEGPADQWFDSRAAAEYLGIGRHSIRRLAAEGSIPTEQAGANCKLYFRRSDLDTWRRNGSAPASTRQAV